MCKKSKKYLQKDRYNLSHRSIFIRRKFAYIGLAKEEVRSRQINSPEKFASVKKIYYLCNLIQIFRPMRTIYFHLLSIYMLLLWAMPSMAQSSRLDSLQRVKQTIEAHHQQLQLQYDSLYKIIAQCKTDAELLVQYEVLNKLDKKSQQLGNRMRKVEGEIQVEQARIEQVEREANLAKKQAAAQALSPVPLKGELNTHPWVDLGLPSGTKWATYNVGTKDIHGVGTRIAWGETATKKTFSPDAYSLNDRELPSYGGDANYDLATLQWGEGWYTPTKQQWDELIEYCDWDYVMINGINGVLFTSPKTYNTIFLPSTGYTDDETYKLKYTTYNLAYWSSTGARTNGAHAYIANYEQGYMTTTNRYVAHGVRAVCSNLGSAVEAVMGSATSDQETAESIQDTATIALADSSAVEPSAPADKQSKSKKKTVKDPEKTAKNIEEAAKVVKTTAKTIKVLQNIFGH